MKKILVLYFALFTKSDLYAQDTIRILHYSETTGYNHNTKQESENLFLRICDSLTENTAKVWVLTSTDSSEIFDNLTLLQKFDVVIWSNTSGAQGLTNLQKQNYELYTNAGGNYLGIHAASDTYRHSFANGNNTGAWDYYAENLSGCSVQENPIHTDPNHTNNMVHQLIHPILDFIPNPWNKTEEYYYWENGFLSNEFIPLLNVNPTGGNTYDATRMTAHYKEHSWGSRSFYTSLGHSVNDYDNSIFETFLKNALLWTANQSIIGSIKENENSLLMIYPNPFSNLIHLDILLHTKSSLSIYDLQGRLIFEQLPIKNSNIDLSFLENGFYVFVINNNDKIIRNIMVKN
jgi:type 1 glutamine amidotransferase